MRRFIRNLSGKTAVVAEVKKTKKTSQAEGLYDLTDLSRDANQRFGFSAKQDFKYYAESL